MLPQVAQDFMFWVISPSDFAKALISSSSLFKRFKTKRRAVFFPIPGKDEKCSTRSSKYLDWKFTLAKIKKCQARFSEFSSLYEHFCGN
jgi:hypothetical protein